MTVWQAYRKTKDDLDKAGIEAPAFEAICLIERVFGYDRTALVARGSENADADRLVLLDALVKRRCANEPLQYILGKWSFMGYDFYVGDGVLIPRDDTEVVASLCLEFLSKRKNASVIDLCAGSGAICVALQKITGFSVTAVELSDSAFSYLEKNIALNNADITAVCADIFKCYAYFEDGTFDLIVSNPPYIKSGDITALQTEVLYEPRLALDGGEDGCDFYRKIVPLWKSKLKIGGAIAFELGEGQAQTVKELLINCGFENIRTAFDLGGTERAIIGTLLRK